MAKQQSKKTLADKKAKGQQPKPPKAMKPLKQKGPQPDFTPNQDREEATADLAFATRIADERLHFPALVAGEHGKYLVGINHGSISEGHFFHVHTNHMPSKDGEEGYDLTTIQGEISASENKPGISIPLSWLFKPTDKCRLASGLVGEIQHDMLIFLKQALFDEIEEQKLLHQQEQLAAKKAEEFIGRLEKDSTTGDMFTLATVDGKAVKPQQTTKLAIKSLGALAPKEFGRYDFKDSANKSCVVDYLEGNGKSLLRIHSMNADHELALAGVRVGLELFGIHLDKEKPLSDSAKACLAAEHYAHLVLAREFFICRIDATHAKAKKMVA